MAGTPSNVCGLSTRANNVVSMPGSVITILPGWQLMKHVNIHNAKNVFITLLFT